MTAQIQRMITVFIALLLSVTLIGCGTTEKPDASTADGSAVAANADQSVEVESQTLYPGFTDRVLDKDHPALTLSNDEQNKVNFVFTITGATSGKTIYTSDPVEPGQSVTWDAIGAGMGTGSHNITIETTAVQADGTELNGVSQTITVTVSSAN